MSRKSDDGQSKVPREERADAGGPNRRTFLAACLAAGAGTVLGESPEQSAKAPAAAAESSWEACRTEALAAWRDLLGEFPVATVPLDAKRKKMPSIEGIDRYHVSFQAEPGDRITAHLLVPRSARKNAPTVICIHGTTWGTGKDRTIGLAGLHPGDPPDKPQTSRAYGLELARWGYVTLSIDLLCDGERVPSGMSCCDSREFYRRHPRWSMVGKNIWDVMRSVDYLETLDVTDPKRIACLGHSLGGHSSLFAAAFEPRLAAAVCNAGVLSWLRDSDHWSRPKGFNEEEKKSKGPGLSYIYIPRFRPYIDDPEKPIPVDFDSLMALVAPRPLLIMAPEQEVKQYGLVEKLARAGEAYRAFDAGDRLSLFSYPGPHNYPPVAKRHSFNWLDRWLGHQPAIPTIWPNVAI